MLLSQELCQFQWAWCSSSEEVLSCWKTRSLEGVHYFFLRLCYSVRSSTFEETLIISRVIEGLSVCYPRMIHQQRWMPRLRAPWFCQRSTATWHWAFRTLCSQISPRAWNRCTTLHYMDSYGGNGKGLFVLCRTCLKMSQYRWEYPNDKWWWCDRWMRWWCNARKGWRDTGLWEIMGRFGRRRTFAADLSSC